MTKLIETLSGDGRPRVSGYSHRHRTYPKQNRKGGMKADVAWLIATTGSCRCRSTKSDHQWRKHAKVDNMDVFHEG